MADLSPGHTLHQAAGFSDVGKMRDHNEDAFCTLQLSAGRGQNAVAVGLLVVADGMGGREAGEVAARIAVSAVAQAVTCRLPDFAIDEPDEVRLRKALEDSVREAHQRVMSAGGDTDGMATTLVAALVVDNIACVANVGDSRAYLFDGKSLRQITADHSLVWLLASLGQIKKDDIYTHPRRNEILRALGLTGELKVDVFSERLEPGWEILLCSDGLWEMVRDNDIEAVLRQELPLLEKTRLLTDFANSNGGADNITVVLLKATTSTSMVSHRGEGTS